MRSPATQWNAMPRRWGQKSPPALRGGRSTQCFSAACRGKMVQALNQNSRNAPLCARPSVCPSAFCRGESSATKKPGPIIQPPRSSVLAETNPGILSVPARNHRNAQCACYAMSFATPRIWHALSPASLPRSPAQCHGSLRVSVVGQACKCLPVSA